MWLYIVTPLCFAFRSDCTTEHVLNVIHGHVSLQYMHTYDICNYMASAMHEYMVKEVNTVVVALKASIEQIETVFVTSYMNVKPQICEETDL